MARHAVRVILSLLMVIPAIAGMSAQAGRAKLVGSGLASAPQAGSLLDVRLAGGITGASPVFVANVGQFANAPGLRFQVRAAPGGTAWLTEESIWVTLLDGPLSSPRGCGLGEGDEGLPSHRDGSVPSQGVNLRLTFVGANPRPQIIPFGRLEPKLSYFHGEDPASWHSVVPVWGGVRYVELYPGVDLEIGTGLAPVPRRMLGSPLRWRLVVRSGAPAEALNAVRLRVEGAEALRINADGQLEITTEVGRIHQALPEVQVPVAEGVWMTAWDSEQPTILGTDVLFPYEFHQVVDVDPVLQDAPDGLVYGTFLGGGNVDLGCALAVDPGDGSVVVSGVTYSPDFPTTPGAFDLVHNGDYDAFVARLSADGTQLLYSTFFGGGSGDGSAAVAVDPSDGTTVVAGATRSSDFPITPGAFDRTHNGDYDVFVARLSADGSTLSYSTFLGGGDVDKGWGVALHPSDGTALVVGRTRSSDFPTTPGSFDPTYNGDWDGFVIRLGADGTALVYGTFLGGSGVDYGEAVAVNPADGTTVFAGGSFSSDFPATPGAFDPAHNGLGDAVVVRLEEDGSDLLYSTFLGGSHHDEGHSVVVDPSTGMAIITGGAMSSDFPTTPGAFDTTFNGGVYDAFVAWLSGDGSTLIHSTFLGGEGADYGAVVAVDPSDGTATVAGETSSAGFPTTPGAFDQLYNGGGSDTFVARLGTDSSTLLYSTFLGGESFEWSWGLATVPTPAGGAAIVAGHTDSPDFPTTPGAFDPVYHGAGDAFAAKVRVASATIHVHAIYMLGRPIGAYHLVLSFVRILDQDQAPVSGATVAAALTRPDGSVVSKDATTNANGRAVFWIAGGTGGTWTTCVEGVVAAGYVYDPTQNEKTCDSIVYPEED